MHAKFKPRPGDKVLPRVDVPFWALTHLGQSVTLATPWERFKAGSKGILDGVTHRSCDGTNRALVYFDDDPLGELVDLPFDRLEAPQLPFDLVRDIPGRLGEVAFMWAHGLDLRKLIAKATFYRYRRELLRYSIDICRPLVMTKRA